MFPLAQKYRSSCTKAVDDEPFLTSHDRALVHCYRNFTSGSPRIQSLWLNCRPRSGLFAEALGVAPRFPRILKRKAGTDMGYGGWNSLFVGIPPAKTREGGVLFIDLSNVILGTSHKAAASAAALHGACGAPLNSVRSHVGVR